MDEQRRVDEKVRTRMAELMASGGVGRAAIVQEVLFMLPLGFVQAYERVFYEAFGAGVGNPLAGIVREGHLGKSNAGGAAAKGRKIGAAGRADRSGNRAGGGKAWAGGDTTRNEDAARLKAKVDRGLRKLARMMEVSLEESEAGAQGGEGSGSGEFTATGARVEGVNARGKENDAGVTRCKGCGRIASGDWAFCPYDGLSLTRS
jgi:hypothetical protein